MDPRLRLRHIACFLEIARAGSLVAAADRLAVTQPAVSKTLRELEDILGQWLFDRSGRGLRLNAAGRAFQQFAGVGMAELERAQNTVRGAHFGQSRLSLGALPTAATELAPRAALAFHEAHPGCVLRVQTGPNWLLLSQLREGTLDLVVGRMAEPDLMAGLSFEQLYLEDVVAVVRADHPLHGDVDADQLLTYPLILPPRGAVIRPTVRGFLTSIGAGDPAPMFETVSLAFGRRTLVGSDAIWFISRGVVSDELGNGRLRTLKMKAPILAGPVGISQREDAQPMIERKTLTDCLRAVAASDLHQVTN
ncbi:LysR family transcriptional regulator, pca operon transcriptional activator [Salinihabitans flavidus]|uniref:LysR family transcriptional regulator, pca operon transcriptional activator n=1 Tax=Salinihabitans flavidus TaxID=569882 RepID=A0A1H8V717_9RHOB|nr:pca operon transcription factor PcaQ [Salinihabitans flavidus]SEP11262.1 LysR family transcriptional regulator, pca operon transcriptional activator [Salinihabitans flavidus]